MTERQHWVISDTHFFHENMLYWPDGRPEFASVKDMHDCMLERWNESVKPGHTVYHLGDVTMREHDEFKKFWPKFHGSKRLIVGNHDNIKWLSKGGFFKEVWLWRIRPELKMVFSHVPIAPTSLYRHEKYLLNVHGHVHRNSVPDVRYFNACVEKNHYRPIHMDELLSYYNLHKEEIESGV